MTKAEMMNRLTAMQSDLETMMKVIDDKETAARLGSDGSNRIYQMARTVGILEMTEAAVRQARIAIQVRYHETPEKAAIALQR